MTTGSRWPWRSQQWGASESADNALDCTARDRLALISSAHASPPQDVLEVHSAGLGHVLRRRVIVSGHVQGVFFRESMRRLAQQRDVSGWVSNRPDGKVEAVLEGEEDAVARLVEFAHRGPRGAHVDSVDVFGEEPEGLSGFSVR